MIAKQNTQTDVLPKIKMLDQFSARLIAAEFKKAFEPIAAQLGLNVEEAGGTLSMTDLKLRFRVTLNSPEVVASMAEIEKSYLRALGLPEAALNGKFRVNGNVYQITNANIGRPKFPITAKRLPDGKLFKFTVHQVRMGALFKV